MSIFERIMLKLGWVKVERYKDIEQTADWCYESSQELEDILMEEYHNGTNLKNKERVENIIYYHV